MDYQEALKKLTSTEKLHIDLGLDRVRKTLETLGNPQDRIKSIQVAGTNGKGSCCAMLESILRHSGYKTGLYTSPHIFDYTERIKINGEDITKSEFGKYFELTSFAAQKNGVNLTEFETLTVMMFQYFAQNNVDIAVIETGLGGRLDATNVIKENICAVITHIDYDHTEILGNTKDKIAYEKSGIIKPNCAVVTGEGYEVIKDSADSANALFVLANPNVDSEFSHALALRGENQIENLSLVLAVIDLKFKNISKNTIIEGLKTVKHPFRFEYIPSRNMIIDGAHNPDCINSLIRNLNLYYPDMKHRYIFGCLKTKDYKKMLEEIIGDKNLDEIYVFEFDNKNACDFETLNNSVEYELKKLNSINDIEFSDDTLSVICGSFYMIKELSG